MCWLLMLKALFLMERPEGRSSRFKFAVAVVVGIFEVDLASLLALSWRRTRLEAEGSPLEATMSILDMALTALEDAWGKWAGVVEAEVEEVELVIACSSSKRGCRKCCLFVQGVRFKL